MSFPLLQLSSLSLWEAVRHGDVHICRLLSAAVPLLRTRQRSSGGRPLLCRCSREFKGESSLSYCSGRSIHFKNFSMPTGKMCFHLLQVDIALTLLTLLVFIHPVYVFIHCRKAAREREESTQTGTKMAEAKL